ncbi:MAG: NFACT RNA binding domain-containing protein, partial [Ruthenibacterium sp.]
MVISAAAVALLVVAVALVVRPGNDPVAAQQPAPVITANAGPAVARLGNQQVSPQELQALLAAVPPQTREQLRGNREALERWIRSRLAEKAVLEQADAQGWAQRPDVVRQTRSATEQIVFRDYLQSVSQVPADYPSAAELQQAYDAGKANWQTPALYRVSQIFLGVNEPQNLEAVRKQAARKEEQAQGAASDYLRVYGELLSANLWAFERGAKSVTVNNYYDGQDVTIPLDVRLSPSGNAQKYFKDYKKKQTAAKMLTQFLADGEREVAYLETVLYEVGAAEGEQALGDIRTELKSEGYLKYYKGKDKKQKPADFFRYKSSDGFLILVGRNNLQNDKLTLKTARGRDVWFHVKNAPGSHAVVVGEGKAIPDTTKTEAAMLAAYHSSQSAGVKVQVDYTEVKNVRKTGDLKPGMVLYDPYETAVVTPDAALAEQLRVQ